MIDELSVNEVAAALAVDEETGGLPDGCVYLDVRTMREFERGHVPGAINVPFVELDPTTGGPVPNEDFGAVVRAVVPLEATVYCGCATGMRSHHAGVLLSQLGYARVFNVAEGFDGQHDPMGRTVAPGWKASGYPVAVGSGGERSYASLLDRARGDA